MKINFKDWGGRNLFKEFIVIFISIVLAFLFDDLRESINERSRYKEALLLFASDLTEGMWSMKSKLDSMHLEEQSWSGIDFKEISELDWFDSLMDNNAVKYWHLKYMIDQHYIGNGLKNIYLISPLAEEIRTKHIEQASRVFTRKYLRAYLTEMAFLNNAANQIHVESERLNLEISKINLFDNQINYDSELMLSNEFKWYYKEQLRLTKAEYLFKDYLVNNKFVKVANGVKSEIERLHLFEADKYSCYTVKPLVERYECQEGTTPEAPVPMIDLIKKARKDYYHSLIKK